MNNSQQCNDVKVLSIEPCGPVGQDYGLWRLDLENPGWRQWSPGQFAMLRPVDWGFDPLWGRPLSLSRVTPERLRFHFQDVGRGTKKLAALSPGDMVTVWGPLGTGFAITPGTPTLLLAGGIGIAPFVEYAATHPEPKRLSLVFGHRPPVSCYPFAEIAQSAKAESFQEQSPADIPRFVELLRARMAEHAPGKAAGASSGLVLACGPTPFLKSVQTLAKELGVKAQLSLENRMACGVGACLGCVAQNAAGHNQQTCTQGPVFWADDIIL